MNKILLKFKSVPKNVLIGIAGVVLMYVGVAGLDSTVTPWWLGAGDSPRHIDYAYSIYNLDIPRFNDPLQYDKFNELANGAYRNQPAAINPPLFYVLHAPFIGPSLDSGNWERAIAIGRALNIFIGALCVVALAWAGWLFGGKRKELFAIATPALGVMFFNFTTLNRNYAVDVLLILFSILAFILSHKIIYNGIKKRYLLWLAILSLAGMSTKASYLVIMFATLLAVVLAALIHGKRGVIINFIRGSIIAGSIFVLILITIGWYYYFQNYRVSGNWASAAPENFGSAHRPYKSLEEVLTSSSLWGNFYERISANRTASKAITAVSVAGLVLLAYRKRIAGFKLDKKFLALVFVMFISTIGILATQIFHAVGYGGYYFRYFLPVLLPFSLFLAYGLLEFRKMRGQLVTVASISLGATTLFALTNASAIKNRIPELINADNLIDRVNTAAVYNGITLAVPTVLFISFIIGSAILPYCLFRASKQK